MSQQADPAPMRLGRSAAPLVGRAQAAAGLRAALLAAPRRVLLHGAPGVGKTALARSVGAALHEEGLLGGGAFEIDMTGVSIDDDINEAVAAKLDPMLMNTLAAHGAHVTIDKPPTWAMLERWLATNDKPWLLVLDNAEELMRNGNGKMRRPAEDAALSDLIQALEDASTGAMHLLLVSRTRALALAPKMSMELPQLAEADAAELLLDMCRARSARRSATLTVGQAKQLAAACGNNPLKLRLVGAVIGAGHRTAAKVIEIAHAAKALENGRKLKSQLEIAAASVQAWWRELLGGILSESELLAAAALCVFAGSFSCEAAGGVMRAVVPGVAPASILEELCGMGVLEEVTGDGVLGTRYAMHHLHQEAASQLLAEAGDAVQQASEAAFVACTLALGQELEQLWHELADSGASSEDKAQLIRKATALPAAEALNIWKATRQALEDEATATGLTNLASKLSQMGLHVMAAPVLERALAIRELVLTVDHLDTASSLDNLGGVLEALERLGEALPLLERALAIRERAQGPDHPDTAGTLGLLAEVLQGLGRLDDAAPLLERALAIRERALGHDHARTAATLGKLARLLSRQNRLGEAVTLSGRALAIDERVLGGDHPEIATHLQKLGYLVEDQGKLSEALPLFQRALSIRERALGPDHPDTATSLSDVAYMFSNLGKHAESRPLFERALAIHERVLGPNHAETAITLHSLGLLLLDTGKRAEAKALFRRAVEIWERVLGPDHPTTFSSLYKYYIC